MRTLAFILVLAFLLAEGVAFLPGPCCLNALVNPGGEEPVVCSHGPGAHPEGCCAPAEPASPPCCCRDKGDSVPALNAAPPDCRCRFHAVPGSDKEVDSDVEPTGLRPVGIVSAPFLEIRDSLDLEGPDIREGTGPPGPPLRLALQVLLL
ncbi:MAG: hypothetical protein ACYS47_10210 [Planctomycetota bacterium]|jgi:hypothetical protein